MSRDDIIALAHKAGTTFVTEFGVASATPEWLERFAALVAAAEREACALLVEDYLDDPVLSGQGYATGCARAIRERGNT